MARIPSLRTILRERSRPGRPSRVPTAASLAVGIVAILLVALIQWGKPPATVLLYHSVADDETGAPEPSIGLAPFRRQMEFLVARGYETVFVRDIVARHATAPVPSRWVALTFDGGYPDFYANVYPVLRQHGLKATLFVIVSDVGVAGSLSWDQLREVHASGLVEIGSHSWDHVADPCLSPEEARREKARSKSVLETGLGVPVVTYAYPYGAFSERAKRFLREAGYRGAVGTVYRWGEFEGDDVFNLRRVYVSRYARLPLMFRFMLSGYYVPARALALRVLNIKTPRDIGCARTAEN